MPSPFDPYYTWLGIPAAEQPPHHYRLLGLSPFESDLTAISHASDRQQSFLKLQTKGEQGLLAEQLIRAVKTAERCLLDPLQKVAYDGNLRVSLAALPGAPASHANVSLPPPLTADDSLRRQNEVPSDSSSDMNSPFDLLRDDPVADSSVKLKSKAGSRSAEPTAIGRLIAVLLPTLVLGGIFLFVGKKFLASSDTPSPKDGEGKAGTTVVAHKDKPDPQRTTGTPPANGEAKVEKSHSGDGNAKPAKSPVVIPKPTGSWNNRVDSDADPNATSTAAKENPRPVDPTHPPEVTIRPPLFGSGARPSAPSDDPSATPTGTIPGVDMPIGDRPAAEKSPAKATDQRLPIPDAAKQEEARKLVLDIFGKELTAAKTSTEKGSLAAKLLQQAQDSKNDPPGCYALLITARESAYDSGDLDLLLRTVDALGDTFNVSQPQEKLAALTAFYARASKSPAQKGAAEAALQASRDWGAAEDYEHAIAAARLAFTIVTDKKIDDPKLNKAILAQGKDLVAAQARRAAYLSSLDKLKTQPDDPDANLAVGRWLWYVKQEVAQGARYIAKSGDADLKPLAEKETSVTKDAAAQVALADDWWSLAQKADVAGEKSVQTRRAEYWYRQASASATGLLRAKVDKRLEELGAIVAAEDAAKVSSAPGKALKLTTEDVRTILNGNAFEVLSRDGKNKAEELDIWEFTAGGDVVKYTLAVTGNVKRVTGANETIARWEPGDNRALMRFTRSPLLGTLQFASKTEGSGLVKTAKGDPAFGFQFKKIVPVATVSLRSFRDRDTNFTLLSNGAVGTPTNTITTRSWSLQGQELTIHDRGNDTLYTLSNDKKTLRGRAAFGGPEVRGEINFVSPPKE